MYSFPKSLRIELLKESGWMLKLEVACRECQVKFIISRF